MDDTFPLFAVTNHHTPSSGRPPSVSADEPGAYHGYFENRHGEQFVFVYRHETRTFEARTDLARTFVDRMGVETETLVDDIRNTAMACYAAWPERIYVIDRDGRIVYKGGVGPFYFAPDELREFLENMGRG
jgi:hypothetical protein